MNHLAELEGLQHRGQNAPPTIARIDRIAIQQHLMISLTGRKTSCVCSASVRRAGAQLAVSVTAEVSGVLVRTMVMNAGLELARFARLGGQSDHFKGDSEHPDLTAVRVSALEDMLVGDAI